MKKLKPLGSKQTTRKLKHPGRSFVEKNGYGKDWPKQRAKALKRDNYCCVYCGAVGFRKKDKRGYKRWANISVHHKVKIRSFYNSRTKEMDYQKANDLSNLATACHRCHKVQDGHAKMKGFVYV